MSAPRRILSLDLSLSVGWAFGADHETPLHGVWTLGKSANLGRVLSGLAGELQDAIAVHRPDVIILEAPLPAQRQASTLVARIQFGLAAVAEMIAHEQDVLCEEERADIVRKMVLGKPRVDKQTVIEWCRAQGWKPATDHDADALVLLRYRHILGRTKVMAGAGSVVF